MSSEFSDNYWLGWNDGSIVSAGLALWLIVVGMMAVKALLDRLRVPRERLQVKTLQIRSQG